MKSSRSTNELARRLDARIDGLGKLLAGVDKGLGARIDTLTRSVDSRISGILGRIDGVNRQVRDMNEQHPNTLIGRKIGRIGERVAALESDVAQNAKASADVRPALTAAYERIGKLEGLRRPDLPGVHAEIISFADRLAAAERTGERAHDAFTTLAKRLDALESAHLKSIAAVFERIRKLESQTWLEDAAAVEAELDKRAEQVAELRGRVDHLQKCILQHSARLDTIGPLIHEEGSLGPGETYVDVTFEALERLKHAAGLKPGSTTLAGQDDESRLNEWRKRVEERLDDLEGTLPVARAEHEDHHPPERASFDYRLAADIEQAVNTLARAAQHIRVLSDRNETQYQRLAARGA